MTTQNHWTDDDELLAQFVLGRVPEVQRTALESHLQSCAHCRALVEKERIVAAGIRLDAREQLKKRLNERLAESVPHRSSNWRYAYGAAAAVVLLVGITLLTRGPSPIETISDSKQISGEKSRIAEDKGAVGRQADKLEAAPSTPGAPHETLQELTKERDRREDRKKDVPSEEIAAGGGVVSDAAQKTKEQEIARNAVDEEQAPAQWIEGQLSEVTAPSAAPAIRSESSKDLSAQSRAVSKGAVARRQLVGGEVVVSQRHAENLPRAQQQLQQRQAVPTQIQQTGDTLRMTLFLDPLVQESELQKAAVEQIGDDSLVIRLPGKIISYKLPAGTAQQIQLRQR